MIAEEVAPVIPEVGIDSKEAPHKASTIAALPLYWFKPSRNSRKRSSNSKCDWIPS